MTVGSSSDLISCTVSPVNCIDRYVIARPSRALGGPVGVDEGNERNNSDHPL